LNDREALFLALGQLRSTAASLDPPPPALPLPSRNELDSALVDGLDLDALYKDLNQWGTEVWVALSTEDDVLGRAFTYGGSLADTYWHAEALGADRFSRLLSGERLEYIAQRFESIAESLPPYTAQILRHTLYQWRSETQIEAQDSEGKKAVLKRLASQTKVWHDLLFGGRSAESYLTEGDRRRIVREALGITIALLLSSMFLVWLAVLVLSSAGRSVTASLAGLPQQLSEAQVALVGGLLDWQMWSTLLATLSSVAVLFTGLVTRLSGWVITFYNRVKEWRKLRAIYRRTYRGWRM
jgi:hypothetical protein